MRILNNPNETSVKELVEFMEQNPCHIKGKGNTEIILEVEDETI